MTGYCAIAPGHAVHHDYHANEYGFPLADERALFERLCLEIFQAGLSWELMLKRRTGFNAAFHQFVPQKIAAYKAADVRRLLADVRIIRNRLKIAAVIDNAQSVLAMRQTHGGFAAFLAAHHPLTKTEWVKLFRKTFKFMGPEVVNEFLMSVGYLPGAHHEKCQIFRHIRASKPPWLMARAAGFKYERP